MFSLRCRRHQKYDAFLDQFKNRQADLEHIGESKLLMDCANSNGTYRWFLMAEPAPRWELSAVVRSPALWPVKGMAYTAVRVARSSSPSTFARWPILTIAMAAGDSSFDPAAGEQKKT